MKTALATKELGLGLTVAPVGVAALTAPLRGVSGVYSDDLAADSLRLVLKKSLELSKAPSVEPPFGFPPSSFDTTPDVGEVFHDNSRTGFNAIENRGRQNVVAIPSEAMFTPSEASKVPLGRLRTIGLQSTFEAKYLFDNFLHVPVAVEPVVRSNGWSGNPQVDADSLSIISEGNSRQTEDNVEEETTFSMKKVSSSRGATIRILGIFGKTEYYLGSALGRGQVNNIIVPVYPEGMQIISRRTGYRLRATCLESLLHSGDCRPHSFAGFLPSLDMQVRDESRVGILASTISQVMKRVGITCSLIPTCAADDVKRLGKLLNRLIKSFSLFLGGLELYPNCSIHTEILPYILQNMQVKSKKAVT